MKVEYITCPNGDWVVLKINGREFYSGHSIPDGVFLELLADYVEGVSVAISEVSNENMEEGNY